MTLVINRRYFGTNIGRTAEADLCSTMIHVDGGFWHLLAYAALQVIAKYFVPRHNHSQAGAAQHHEIAPIERIDTARERRRPFVLIATNYSIHTEMYGDAFDFNAKLRPWCENLAWLPWVFRLAKHGALL